MGLKNVHEDFINLTMCLSDVSKHTLILRSGSGVVNFGGVLMGAAYLANEYAPIFIFILIAIGMGAAPLVLTLFVSEQKPDAEKLSAYECGFEAFEDARLQIDVRFYLLAILFVIFDLESAFLFPWAIVLDQIGLFGFVEMVMFLVILLVGYVYAWKKGALQWE